MKLAIQLLQSGANIKKESEEIVNLDEGVPDEVRNWLLSTFSESCQSNQKSQSSNRRGLKGVATGISAAIRMERIMWGLGRYQILVIPIPVIPYESYNMTHII